MLLTAERKYRLTEDELLQLRLHLKMISGWAEKVPAETHFFMVDWQPVLVLPRVPGFTRERLGIAAYLQPLHSQLCAISVQVLWKADQLIRALCPALNGGDMIVAATMSRSLIETSASFGHETHEISKLWWDRKCQPATDMHSLANFYNDAKLRLAQILFGTKLKEDGEAITGIERTNILSLIDKAEKTANSHGLRQIYEILCDAVHPSIGSNRCFWAKEPWGPTPAPRQSHVVTISLDRNARGILANLPYSAAKGALWALDWLGKMWVNLERTRNDLCLTAKLYALPNPYYGLVRPGKPDDYCRCGSQKLLRDCNHEFGPTAAPPKPPNPQPGAQSV